MTRTHLTSHLAALALLLMPLLVAAGTSEFPGRKIYPNVSVITLEQLKARRHEVQVVDVRSAYEYQTLHITGAINIPVSGEHFAGQMANLRAEHVKDIVVYCNGKTCMKSYTAAKKYAEANISNVYAYDAGIMDWAKAYPEAAELLGETLDNPSKLISKEDSGDTWSARGPLVSVWRPLMPMCWMSVIVFSVTRWACSRDTSGASFSTTARNWIAISARA